MTRRKHPARPPKLPPWLARDSGARAARRHDRLLLRFVPERRERRRWRRRHEDGHEPVRPREELERRGRDLQRRLRLRLRQVRRRRGQEAEGLLGRHDQGGAVHADRPAAAASLRRRQPARPDRQLGCERHRVQHHREAARDARRRLRGEQLRRHQDRGHALPEREGPRHLRRQVRGDELRDDGLRRVVLRIAVQEERLDRAGDLGRRARPRRQGQGRRQVPVRVGQGGGDVLPDDGRQLRHQGGRRRGAPGAGEPQAEVLVDAAAPGRLQRPRRDGVEEVLRPRRRRHPVHRCPGEVEQ